MKRTEKILMLVFVTAMASMMSCGEDEPVTPAIDEPATYVFLRDGVSSVSFSGQSTRIAMAEEIFNALHDETLSESTIAAMFNHQQGEANFSDATLNASAKNVKSKVAASADLFSANTVGSSAIKADFDSWIADQANNVFPSWDNDAAEGVAGAIQEAGGGSVRYVNSRGIECDQAVAKSLIGGLMVDQALNNYLGVAVLDAGENIANHENGLVEDGKNYTTMEHKWDEA